MNVCVAQTRPVTGDIEKNISHHERLIGLAVDSSAELIVFPELSLTGYEPSLGKQLAIDTDDRRLDVFQVMSDEAGVVVGVGAPIQRNGDICISLILFQPRQLRRIYSKKYLHPDEQPFFASGQSFPALQVKETNVAFAICYELSIAQHREDAINNGGEVYVASVAKPESGLKTASETLSDFAAKHQIPVLLSNSVGPCDNFVSCGKSSVWDSTGAMVGRLDSSTEGILVFATDAHDCRARSGSAFRA